MEKNRMKYLINLIALNKFINQDKDLAYNLLVLNNMK